MFLLRYKLLLLIIINSFLFSCYHDPEISPVSELPLPPLETAEKPEEPEEPCLVAQTNARQFLPRTSEPPMTRILPATENECGFYNWSLQAFLHTTQPDNQGKPAFLNYPSVEDVFKISAYSQAPNKQAQNQEPPLLNAGFRQAGEAQGILVDVNHNPIFYSIYINQQFADFVQQAGLNQLINLLKNPAEGGVSAELEFPPGAIELKAAWRIIEPGENLANYFTMPARVPLLESKDGQVITTSQTREVEVALLGLHVVGVVQDHPEFIWATFEHVNAKQERDLAPASRFNPNEGPLELSSSTAEFPLFSHESILGQANQLPRYQKFDEKTQKFSETTAVFRAFPASLSTQSDEDEELLTLNQDLTRLFQKTQTHDFRQNYQMVGALWIDKPGSDLPNGVFKADRSFFNLTDEPILAGEDALSNMALESFTQITRPHCFSCHNTLSKPLNDKLVLPPRKVNVSNVLTFFAQAALQEQAIKD